MVTTQGDTCDKCRRRNPIDFAVEPEEAWKTVVLNRWRRLCPSCFDQLAEQAGVRYSFAQLRGRVVVGSSGAAKPLQAEAIEGMPGTGYDDDAARIGARAFKRPRWVKVALFGAFVASMFLARRWSRRCSGDPGAGALAATTISRQ